MNRNQYKNPFTGEIVTVQLPRLVIDNGDGRVNEIEGAHNLNDLRDHLAAERVKNELLDPKVREMAELRRRMAQLEAS